LVHLLLIDGSNERSKRAAETLTQAGFGVYLVSTAATALHALATGSYAIVILGFGLPENDGQFILDAMRRREDDTPVIILATRGNVESRVRRLSCGAEGSDATPAMLEELVSQVGALLRRPKIYKAPIRIGNVEVDAFNREVFVKGKSQAFSPREMALLELLVRMNGRIVPKTLAEEHLFGDVAECRSNAIEVYVHRLRKQLQGSKASVNIRTVRGRGYEINEKKS